MKQFVIYYLIFTGAIHANLLEIFEKNHVQLLKFHSLKSINDKNFVLLRPVSGQYEKATNILINLKDRRGYNLKGDISNIAEFLIENNDDDAGLELAKLELASKAAIDERSFIISSKKDPISWFEAVQKTNERTKKCLSKKKKYQIQNHQTYTIDLLGVDVFFYEHIKDEKNKTKTKLPDKIRAVGMLHPKSGLCIPLDNDNEYFLKDGQYIAGSYKKTGGIVENFLGALKWQKEYYMFFLISGVSEKGQELFALPYTKVRNLKEVNESHYQWLQSFEGL